MEKTMTIGEKVRATRKQLSIRQGEFAKMFSISQKYLCQVEKNKQEPMGFRREAFRLFLKHPTKTVQIMNEFEKGWGGEDPFTYVRGGDFSENAISKRMGVAQQVVWYHTHKKFKIHEFFRKILFLKWRLGAFEKTPSQKYGVDGVYADFDIGDEIDMGNGVVGVVEDVIWFDDGIELDDPMYLIDGQYRKKEEQWRLTAEQ
jgi:transcriptional regulator with XRE-family HTH domain